MLQIIWGIGLAFFLLVLCIVSAQHVHKDSPDAHCPISTHSGDESS